MTTKLPLLLSLILSLSFIGFKSYKKLNTNTTYVHILKAGGVGSLLGLDRTGSPISGGINCGQCHSGAINNAAISITAKDGMGTVVTGYIPGAIYTLEYNVSSNFGFARGFQSVLLDGTNAQAGALSSPGAGTTISTIGVRQYVEHSTPSFSAGSTIFTTSWTAPTGMSDITIYAAGIVGNGNNATSGDEATNSESLTLVNNTLNTTVFELVDSIKLFPNPSNGSFNLDLGKNYKETTIDIIDVNGKLIKTINAYNEKTIRFNIEASTGLYFAKIKTSSNELVTLKLSIK
ncbi:choice-of-anchor V domain-containing protein [Aurantibacter sp.]|uniref:choice-of-anchor V domain-containing protein n=1 Tax=Aurantibacter sp. TaxID=2807103 RepID=UPI0035C7B85E